MAIKGSLKKFKINPANKAPIDMPMFLIIMILLVFGLVMMFSASYAVAIHESDDGTKYIIKQLIFSAVGLVVMFVASYFDYHWLRNHIVAYGLYGISFVLLILVLIIGREINGSKRWIYVGEIGFQPSEVTKLAIIIVFAYLISTNYSKLKTFKVGILPFAVLLGASAALIMMQTHLSCTILICIIAIVICLSEGLGLLTF